MYRDSAWIVGWTVVLSVLACSYWRTCWFSWEVGSIWSEIHFRWGQHRSVKGWRKWGCSFWRGRWRVLWIVCEELWLFVEGSNWRIIRGVWRCRGRIGRCIHLGDHQCFLDWWYFCERWFWVYLFFLWFERVRWGFCRGDVFWWRWFWSGDGKGRIIQRGIGFLWFSRWREKRNTYFNIIISLINEFKWDILNMNIEYWRKRKRKGICLII